MWPGIHLPGTDIDYPTYHLLNVASWFAFLAIGLRLTKARPEFRWRWWWLFFGMALCYSAGAGRLHRLVRGGGEVPSPIPGAPSGGGFWGGPLLFLGWTILPYLTWRIRAYPFLDVFAIAFSVSQAVAKSACFAAGCCHAMVRRRIPSSASRSERRRAIPPDDIRRSFMRSLSTC